MRKEYYLFFGIVNLSALIGVWFTSTLHAQTKHESHARYHRRTQKLPIFDEPMVNYMFGKREHAQKDVDPIKPPLKQTPEYAPKHTTATLTTQAFPRVFEQRADPIKPPLKQTPEYTPKHTTTPFTPQAFARVFEQRDILVDDPPKIQQEANPPGKTQKILHQQQITAAMVERIAWESNGKTCEPEVTRLHKQARCGEWSTDINHDFCPIACPKVVSEVQGQCPGLAVHSSMENDGTCVRGDTSRVCMSVSSLSDVHIQYFSYDGLDFYSQKTPSVDERNLGFLSSFVSNCVGWRKDALQGLTNALTARKRLVHNYGNCMHDADESAVESTAVGRDARKNDIGKRHRYVFAFENSEKEGYTTEKLFYLLTAGAVPVYRGAPDVRKFLPSKDAAVVVDGSNSPEEIAAMLDQETDEVYHARLAWRNQFADIGWLSNMDLSVWHSTCRLCVHIRSMEIKPPTSGIWVRERGFLEFFRVDDHVWQRQTLAEILVEVSAAVESRLSEAERKTRPQGVGAVVRMYRAWDRQKCSLLSYHELQRVAHGSEIEVVMENPGWTRRRHLRKSDSMALQNSITEYGNWEEGFWVCLLVHPNDSNVPNFGKYFVLNTISINAHSQAYVVVENANMVDVLFSDYTGAFNLKPIDRMVVIPWNHQAPPQWLISYGTESSVFVKQKKTDHTMPISTSQACPSSFSKKKLTSTLSFDDIGPVQHSYWKRRLGSATGLVTLCTQLTVDRISRLQMMAQNYNGPISAVVYVGFRSPKSTQSQEEEKSLITSAWQGSKYMQEYVDIHLVIDNKNPWVKHGESFAGHSYNPYPVNLLRQLSVKFSQTDYVLYLEADMIPRPGLHSFIQNTWEKMRKKSDELGGKLAFIVPVYNAPAGGTWQGHEQGHDLQNRVPRSKSEIRQDLKKFSTMGFVRMSRIYSSHSNAWYDQWEGLERDDFIEAGDINGKEPYFIIHKSVMPAYDVLFWGMTGDKVGHVQDVVSFGVKFVIHPEAWAVHFDSVGLGDSWIASETGWRIQFVNYVHKISKSFRLSAREGIQNRQIKDTKNAEHMRRTSPQKNVTTGRSIVPKKFEISDTTIGSAIKYYRNSSMLKSIFGLTGDNYKEKMVSGLVPVKMLVNSSQNAVKLIHPRKLPYHDLAVLILTCNRQTSLEALLETLSHVHGIREKNVYVSIDCKPGPLLNLTLWSSRGLAVQLLDSHQRYVIETGEAKLRRDERVNRHWLHAVHHSLLKHKHVLYLEDDHLVHPAILHDAEVLLSAQPTICPACFAVQLGCHQDCWGLKSTETTASDVARMEPGNMGIVYNRNSWQWFLQYIDEYCSIYGIWDVNLHHLLSVHTQHQHALTFLKARVVHNSACGSDRNTGGRAQCDKTVLQRDRERLMALDMSMNSTLSDHGTAETPVMTIQNTRAIQADNDTRRRCIDSTRQHMLLPAPRKIISCFPYNGEKKMLVDRVQSMFVSFFVVSESRFAMNGSPKKMTWQQDFDALHNNTVRFKYLQVNKNYYQADSNEGRWKQEVAVRNILGVGVKELYDTGFINDEDIVLVTDADEIVNDDTLGYIRKHLKHGEYAQVSLAWFLYNKCWMHRKRTMQPAAVTVKTLRQSLEWNAHFIRALQNDRVVKISLRKMAMPILDNGYHCSWCFGKAEFRRKVTTSLEIPTDLQRQDFDDARIEKMWINGLNLQGGIHGKKICSAAEFERELSFSGLDRIYERSNF